MGSPTNNANNIFEFKDDLTHVTGGHSLKFGFDFMRLQKFVYTGTNSQGAFTFNGSVTGNAVADLLLGDGFNYTESILAPNGYFFANTLRDVRAGRLEDPPEPDGESRTAVDDHGRSAAGA